MHTKYISDQVNPTTTITFPRHRLNWETKTERFENVLETVLPTLVWLTGF